MHTPLEHAHVLVTGATGFVGQAVVEKLLFSYPTTRVTVLVRPRGDLTAQRRAEKLLRNMSVVAISMPQPRSRCMTSGGIGWQHSRKSL